VGGSAAIDWSVNAVVAKTTLPDARVNLEPARAVRTARRGHNAGVRDAFGIVVIAVVAVAVVGAVAAMLGSGGAYDEIGRGGLSLGDGDAAPAAPEGEARDEEIRQMLEARSARRVRRGEAPLDVAAEARRLARSAPDPALEAEVRALVQARNARRLRRGLEPLDEDAEVERRLDELTD
jgi:hypothetical protein